MVLLLLLVVVLPWRVARYHSRAIPMFLVLTAVSAVALWFTWTRDMTFDVGGTAPGTYYQEDYRTWYKVFVTGELAAVIGATSVLAAAALRRRFHRVPSVAPETRHHTDRGGAA
jgi:hypothetical protein